MKSLFIISILLIVVFVFSGCIDEPVQTNDVISGKIYGVNYDNLFFVSSDNLNNTIADNQGNFSLKTSGNPYTLTVTSYDVTDYFFEKSLKFPDATVKNPQIIFDEYTYSLRSFLPNKCILPVKYPSLQNKHIFLQFISNNKFYQSGTYSTGEDGTDSASLSVYIENNKSSIEGQLIFLAASYTSDTVQGFHFISFDRFGIKNITLNNGENPEINFTEEDISFNPDEYLMPINVNLPLEFSLGDISVYISFLNTYKNSDLYLSSVNRFNNPILVPILPLSNFNFKILTRYTNGNFLGQDWSYVQPGQPGVISVANTITLLSPAPNSENVKPETEFEIEDNGETGLYEFFIEKFVGPNPRIGVFTNKKKISFGDFKTGYIDLTSNVLYSWQVIKFSGFNSVDEFISEPFVIDNRAEKTELTVHRRFKTAP